MRRVKAVPLVMLALGVPVVLSLAAYLLSVPLGVATPVPALPAGVEQGASAGTRTAQPSPSAADRRVDGCAEPEHDVTRCDSSSGQGSSSSTDGSGSSGRSGPSDSSDSSGPSNSSGSSGFSGSSGSGGGDSGGSHSGGDD